MNLRIYTLTGHFIRYRIMDEQLTNLQQLRDAIMSIWTKISEEYFQHLVESMPRRIKTVLKAKGGPTRYEQGVPNKVASECVYIYIYISKYTEILMLVLKITICFYLYNITTTILEAQVVKRKPNVKSEVRYRKYLEDAHKKPILIKHCTKIIQ